MPKHIFLIIVLIGLIAAAATFNSSWLPKIAPSTSTSTVAEEINSELQSLQQAIFTPAPLRGPIFEDKLSLLTKEGTFSETNKQRTLNGLPALERNIVLDEVAAKKLQDMFDKQYFEHVSPDGKSVTDLADNVNYEYLIVGENLALGNFETDADLLEAWMNSPGHKANIVSPKFQELGIAVGEGMFEGHKTWLAVQTFGTQASVCPSPSAADKANLEQLKNSIAAIGATLTIEADAIKALAEKSESKTKEGNENIQKGNDIYQETGDEEQAKPYWDKGHALQDEGKSILEEVRKKQESYNAQVEKINNDQAEFSADTIIYNADVKTYNACIKKFQ